MMKRLANLLKRLTALIESGRRCLQSVPKLDTELEYRVREQLTTVTSLIDEAFTTARTNRTRVQPPGLEGQFGDTDLQFELIDEPIEGIVRVTYTGDLAQSYFDILNHGLGDACHVFSVDLDPGFFGEQPSVTAELRLPIKTTASFS